MNKSEELSVQSAADRTKAVKSAVEELRAPQNLETGHCNI